MLNDFLNQVGPSTVGGLASGAIYALIALGYTMVYGVLRLINFAHSEIFMIGSFAALFAILHMGITGPLSGFALAGTLLVLMLVAMAASGGAAVLLEQVAYRPLRRRNASRLAALISAIGASIFLQEFFALIVIPKLFDRPSQGRLQVPVPRLLERESLLTIGNVEIRNDHVIILVSAVIMMILLDVFVNRTRIGRGIRATSQDPETATLMGVNIDKIIRTTFLVGGAMAGVAALLYAMEFENLRYNVGFLLGVKAFTAAVLGGIGNLRGALLGGLLLGVVENYASGLFGSQWKDFAAFVVLVVLLMFRPTGLLGESLGRARA